jgi:hypothetical protein
MLLCALVSACDGASMIDAGPDAGALMLPDGSFDATTPLLDGGRDAGRFDPSPANVGWIGGACAETSDCADVEDAICLRDGYPNGTCAQPCEGLCPDRGAAGDTLTVCVDGIPHGEPHGICLSRCDPAVFPPDGCAQGYRCVDHNRYGMPSTVIGACVPDRPRCGGSDTLIPLAYPDRGAVWIPAEAGCEPSLDLLVMLHGINPSSNPTPSLGGGRRLELLVRQLIDAGLIRPIVLAEPVHFQGSSTFLYGAGFDPAEHLTRVQAILDDHGVSVASLSYVGHSGAGCDADNGLYEVLDRVDDLVPTFAPSMRLWGLMDVCYGGAYHYQRPIAVLGGRDVVIANMSTTGGSPSEFDAFDLGLLETPTAFDCDPIYGRCVHHPSEAWCSYRTRTGVSHDTNPYFFFREVIPQVFAVDASIVPCR